MHHIIVHDTDQVLSRLRPNIIRNHKMRFLILIVIISQTLGFQVPRLMPTRYHHAGGAALQSHHETISLLNKPSLTFNSSRSGMALHESLSGSVESDDGDVKEVTSSVEEEDESDNDELLIEEESKALNRKLTREFFGIGIPAFVQLAAEPLASLVDTAYLGRLGPEVLGGAGLAISAQYAVSKLYNDPLLRASISLVASQDGKARGGDGSEEDDNKDLSVAVSSAILLALTVGLVQMVIYSVLTKGIIHRFGVGELSPMWNSAVSYLRVRALGTPAATLWLVVNGIFRGLGDTRTPLIYSLFFTGLNAILDPIFIFTLHFGASGAAAGTALAQYIALVPLLLALNRRVPIEIVGQLQELKNSLKAYLQAGGYVLFRTVGKVLAYSVCARQAVSNVITYTVPSHVSHVHEYSFLFHL